MMSGAMRRWSKFLVVPAVLTAALSISACGTQRITVPKANKQIYHGAVLFSERCAGCHTLYAAGTHGSAPNIRTAQAISGPNFNVRCERPIDRVLYAIENGGFSGAYMPQNVVVGQDAVDVAKFVATYAGAKAPKQVGVVSCQKKPIGTLAVPPKTTPVATGGGSSSSGAVSVAAGMSVFKTNCAVCHTLAAAGSTGTVGPNLDQLKPSDALVIHQVTFGGGVMPAFGHTLSQSQIKSVALFVSSVAGKPAK
jgi:mono/diheme cytochrome c family protein